jgi:hypothetical protein
MKFAFQTLDEALSISGYLNMTGVPCDVESKPDDSGRYRLITDAGFHEIACASIACDAPVFFQN